MDLEAEIRKAKVEVVREMLTELLGEAGMRRTEDSVNLGKSTRGGVEVKGKTVEEGVDVDVEGKGGGGDI